MTQQQNEPSPRLLIEPASCRAGAAPGQWRAAWRMHNLEQEPVVLLSTWLPHDKFANPLQGIDPPLRLAPGGSPLLELPVACNELPGSVLDPATGAVTLLGPTGFRNLLGMQFDTTFRPLYAITGERIPPVLVALDPTTGQSTAIAETNMLTQAESLAFTADGRLVVGGSDGNLYQDVKRTGPQLPTLRRYYRKVLY